MDITKRIGRLLAAAAIFALASGAGIPGDRVSEVCVVAGDIGYCAPKDV